MKLSYRMYSLPLFAGLVLASAVACSEGSSSDDDDASGGAAAAEGGAGSSEGGSTAQSSGGSSSSSTASTAVSLAEFDNGIEDFLVGWSAVFAETDLVNVDATLSAALKADTTIKYNANEGYGTVAGFMEVDIPFNTEQFAYQQIEVDKNLTGSLDLTGKIVHCMVNLVSGGLGADETITPGAKMMVKSSSTNWVYAMGPRKDLTAGGGWSDVMVDLASPSGSGDGFDPADIVQIGVSIETGGGETTGIEAAVVYIDHCYYE